MMKKGSSSRAEKFREKAIALLQETLAVARTDRKIPESRGALDDKLQSRLVGRPGTNSSECASYGPIKALYGIIIAPSF